MSDDVASSSSSRMCLSLPESGDITQPDSTKSGSLCFDPSSFDTKEESDCDDVVDGKLTPRCHLLTYSLAINYR